MSLINIFLYEFNHFRKSKAKVIAYLLFLSTCVYALYNGFSLQNKQKTTIDGIEQKIQEGITKVLGWFDEGKTGPEDRPWIDVSTPFWALWHTPTYTIKTPSPLLPLGIGQSEQYGFYKQVSNWSTTYDSDMVEELANPERLINGNIDFAFIILFLMPLLLIVLTYNINGLEKDQGFDRLISIQVGNIQHWLLARSGFYFLLILVTNAVLILSIGILNNAFADFGSEMISLLIVATLYLCFWTIISYFIILKSSGTSSQAFTMISVWLLLCVVIPGAVHQYASIRYPANLMTDFLDVNRKEAYSVFEVSSDTLAQKLKAIYPQLANTKNGQDSVSDESIVQHTVSALINEMNKLAVNNIESLNDEKNQLIAASYWFNPVSFFQNKWNNITSTDYNAYKKYRSEVQKDIDNKMELLVIECWDKKKVDKITYQTYLERLK